MNVEQLVSALDDAAAARPWLQAWGIVDQIAGHASLLSMAQHGITLDLLAELVQQLADHLPRIGDPDLALSQLGRFVAAARNPISLAALFQEDRSALPDLLQILSTSRALGELLVNDPAAYDVLRMTDGQPVARSPLVEEICGEVAQFHEMRDVMLALRNFKRRETLRIAFGDIIRQQPTDVVVRQLAFLADAIFEAAVRAARVMLETRHGIPRDQFGQRAKFVVLGLGRFGGLELDYESHLQVLFLWSGRGRTDHSQRTMENGEFFHRLADKVTQLLGADLDLGTAYQVDPRESAPYDPSRLCLHASEARRHFDTRGRTWERQLLTKGRPAAGDVGLGLQFLESIEPWVYRRYLSRADLTGIKALKRRLEQRKGTDESTALDVEREVSGIEFIAQFLQLMNGADHPELRIGNTLSTLEQLEQTACLSAAEARILEENYDWLRRVEHRLEIMDSLPNKQLPSSGAELRRLAWRCRFAEEGGDLATQFRKEYLRRVRQSQETIDRLLDETFADEAATPPETDLVLDPAPSNEKIRHVLEPYGFRDILDAHHNLVALSVERIPFLSTRRCRHFLAQISRSLLRKIAETPSPDATLANLCRVSDSLGGKGVLWELFHMHPPSLDLYVRLCSSSPYLTSILTRYPGMIDELMDSLMLKGLPTLGELQETLSGLCDKAGDIEPILHSFKDTQHLNVGVRELLGKADIRSATATLSDVAESCLQQIAQQEYARLVRKHGQPRLPDGEQACELIILAMGKFGGREPNYHSDIDLMFLFEANGQTHHPPTIRGRDTTSNRHFFSELGQRIIRFLSDHGSYGRLYDSDPRLRPTGLHGPVAASIDEFQACFMSGSRTIGEARALCQARPVYGSEPVRAKVSTVLRDVLTSGLLDHVSPLALREERLAIQETAGPRNLKRGPGGTVDIEFIAQVLQLQQATQQPAILRTGTLEAIAALVEASLLSAEDAEALSDNYRFLRQVEACLRLLNTTARHDLPREPDDLAKLAYLLRFDRPSKVETECARVTKQNRKLFDRLLFDTPLRHV